MSETLSLADACEIIVDCEHKTAPTATPGTEYGFSVGTPHIRNGRILLSQAKPVDRQSYAAWTAREVPRVNDLILAREAPVGQVGRVRSGERICLGQRTVLLRPDANRVNPQYLHYLLISPQVQQVVHSKAAGSTVPHLNMKDIRSLLIPALPDRWIQDVIGTLLGALDDKIAVNERIATTALELGRTALKSYSNKSQEKSTLNNLIDLLYGKALPAQHRNPGDIPVFGCTGQVGWHDSPLTNAAAPVVGRKGANAGHVSWIPKPGWVIDTAYFAVSKVPHIYREALFFLLEAAQLGALTADSAVPGLNRTTALKHRITLPHRDDLFEFNEQAKSVLDMASQAEAEVKSLATLRDTLLPKLVSGKLRIKDAEKQVEEGV